MVRGGMASYRFASWCADVYMCNTSLHTGPLFMRSCLTNTVGIVQQTLYMSWWRCTLPVPLAFSYLAPDQVSVDMNRIIQGWSDTTLDASYS
jgi:hypothetical protein